MGVRFIIKNENNQQLSHRSLQSSFQVKKKLTYEDFKQKELSALKEPAFDSDDGITRQNGAIFPHMINNGPQDEQLMHKYSNVDKLVGQLKEGKYIKKRYMQMIMSAALELQKDQILLINESKHKQVPI